MRARRPLRSAAIAFRRSASAVADSPRSRRRSATAPAPRPPRRRARRRTGARRSRCRHPSRRSKTPAPNSASTAAAKAGSATTRGIGVGTAAAAAARRQQCPGADAHRRRLARRANGAQFGRRAKAGGRFHRRVGEIGATGDERMHTVGDQQIGVGVEHLVERREPVGQVGRQPGDERALRAPPRSTFCPSQTRRSC